jgi:1-deoxy-D-xylulose-5-phosphate synthase
LAKNHELLITIEEGAIGGFASAVTKFLMEKNLHAKLRCLFMKDEFIEQNKIEVMQEEAEIGVSAIIKLIESFIKQSLF